MRIAFVNSTRRWGGVKTWCLSNGAAALAKGHDVFVYGRDERFVEAARAQGMEGRLMPFGADFNPRSIAAFYDEFRRRNISHVVVNVGKDIRTAGIAARLRGLPVVVHVGAPHDFSPSSVHLWVHRFIRPAYVGTSKFIVNGIRKHVSYLADARVEAVHPGTLMPPHPPFPSCRPYTLITTSQLTPPKRHQDLLRACGQLKREGLDFRLRIVGTGDQEQTLRALAVACDLEDRVVFRGFVSDVGAELRQADIFVLPTDAEPLGIALEEAMAHGLFPLARNSGGVPEIWPARFRARLLSPGAGPEEFAAGLRSLLAVEPSVLDEWRQAVQNHARVAFSQEAQFEKFAAFLESCRSA